jgi:hypothetical protein
MTRPTLVVIAFALLAAACGPTAPECNASTCAGCCDAVGVCLDGARVDACGALGTACVPCGLERQCVAGACVPVAPPDAGPVDAGCEPLTDAELCAQRLATCGTITADDGCGRSRTVSCGGCGPTQRCTNNACVCQPKTDAQVCAERQATCGSLVADDGCGRTKLMMCGACASTQACSNNSCVCQPESDAQLCAASGKSCGLQTLTDRCGRARTVSCGTCAAPTTCSTQGTCSCQPETNAALCARNSYACGSLTARDNCGVTRTVTCGTCSGVNACVAGTCTCQGESTAQFCARQGASCGVVTGTDQCGQARSVNCGSCSGAQTCGGGGAANRCGCTAETDAAFCARRGANCGSASGADNCGAWRTAACGTCGGTQTCGGGGTSNVCACAPESNAQFAARLGKDCGTVTAPDNCGVTRTVTLSTFCSGTGRTCGGGGVANVCGCSAETDAELCTAKAATCGAISAVDRCGAVRPVSSCGTCSGTGATCGGGGRANACGCIAETDGAFCVRKGASCGALTDVDNCGAPRTVASCGACSASSVCGLSTANVCSPYVEPFDAMCNPDGWCFEQPLPFAGSLTDVAMGSPSDVWFVGRDFTWARWDGARWSGGFDVRRGNLNGLWVSGSEVWAVGDNATVVRRAGGAWVDVQKPTGVTRLNAVFGFSGNEVWVGGTNAVARWNGSTWQTWSMPGAVTGLWGGASNDVWAVGTGFLSRWNGAAWTQQPGIAWNFSDIDGSSTSDVWAVAPGHVARFNGTFWADVATDNCTGVWVGGPTQVRAACSSSVGPSYTAVRTWNGTTWSSVPAVTYASRRRIAGTVAVTESGSVERLVNGAWVVVAPTQVVTTSNVSSVQTFSNGAALAFDGIEVLARIAGVWRAVTTPQYPRSVFGFSATDYVVGSQDSDTQRRPIAYRVTGGTTVAQSLSSFTSLRYPELSSLWAASPTDLYGVGQTYWNYSSGSSYTSYGAFAGNGTSWSATLTGATNDANGTSDLFRVHGSAATNVWAIDRGATVWRLLGGTWTRFTTGSPLTSGDGLRALWVQSNTRTWLGGTFGVADFDAATGYGPKRAVPAPTLAPLPPLTGTFNPHEVRGFTVSPTLGFHAVGTSGGRGTAWTWNGTAWTLQSLFPRAINAVDVAGNDVLAVGDSGLMFRRVR